MSETDRTQPRKSREFTPESTAAPEREPPPRSARMFDPQLSEQLDTPPEPITAGERLPHVADYSGIKLEKLPIKGLKTFAYSAGLLIVGLLGWETYSAVATAWQQHWLFGVGLCGLLTVVTASTVRVGIAYFFDRQNQQALDDLRRHGARLQQGSSRSSGISYIAELEEFYRDKPQAIFLQRSLDTLPDYSDDRELSQHLERSFIQPLDSEALRRVSIFSAQTGSIVAVSPWAAVDMLLALWRSLKLIDEIAQVYGMRPSMANRYKLLSKVIRQLAFVGASELLVDQLLEDVGGVTVLGMASTRAAQGLGAGVYTARIGLAAMAVSRPCEFNDEIEGSRRPRLAAVIAPLLAAIKQRFKKR